MPEPRIGAGERLDLAYIDTWSIRLDVQILLRTVPVVISARGAH